jgi:plastocyanin
MKRLLLVALSLLVAGGSLGAATVSGRVAFITKRGQHPIPDETVVWLEPTGSNRNVTKRPPATFTMTTRGKTLLPHVLALPAGSSVTFPNQDPISHNLFSLSGNNGFDLGLYRSGPGKSQKFATPGIVSVYCNVHPTMSAVIHVMATPYYGLTDTNSAFSLPDVAPGKYDLIAWNEQGGVSQALAIDVPAAGAANLALTIDSRNYRQNPHTNKEGKAYQAPPRDY